MADSKHPSERLQQRLSAVGGRMASLVEELPDTKAGRHVRDQLLRSASAPGAHYAEARAAQSRSDFVHKVTLAAKELRESRHWVAFAEHAQMVEGDTAALIDETGELIAMLTSAQQTAREGGE